MIYNEIDQTSVGGRVNEANVRNAINDLYIVLDYIEVTFSLEKEQKIPCLLH